MINISPPDFLSPRACEEYHRIAALMGDTLRDLDMSALADYAQTFDDVAVLQELIDFEGTTVVNPINGSTKTNPNCNLLMAKRSQLASLRKELGLNPTSRKEKPKPNAKGLREAMGAPK